LQHRSHGRRDIEEVRRADVAGARRVVTSATSATRSGIGSSALISSPCSREQIGGSGWMPSVSGVTILPMYSSIATPYFDSARSARESAAFTGEV
jgi:hypothetical protein